VHCSTMKMEGLKVLEIMDDSFGTSLSKADAEAAIRGCKRAVMEADLVIYKGVVLKHRHGEPFSFKRRAKHVQVIDS